MDGAACVQLCSDPPIFKYKLTALTFRICLVFSSPVGVTALFLGAFACLWRTYWFPFVCVYVYAQKNTRNDDATLINFEAEIN